jgi:hypothetical protein
MFVAALTASSAASSIAPPWIAIFGTISALITAIGVILAGAFAYFKFVKGRTLHPRCSIAIDSKIVKIEGARALQISVIAQNEGQIALLLLSDAPQRLIVVQADSTVWEQACNHKRPVQWEKSAIKPTYCGLAIPEGELVDPPKQEEGLQHPRWWRWLSRRWLLELLDGDKLEPGEQWARSALVPVAPNSVAYLLRIEINACRHVAVRHVIRHRRRCCNTRSSHLTWSREVYAMSDGEI